MRGVGGLRPPCPEMTVKSAHAPCSCAAGQLLGHRGSEMGGSAAVDDHDTVCREEIKPAQHFHGNAARRSWCTSSGISLPDFMGTGWWGPAVPRPHGGSRGHRHGPRTGRGRENPGLRPAPLTTPASGLAVPESRGAGVGVRILRRNRTNGVSAGRPLCQGTAAGTPLRASAGRTPSSGLSPFAVEEPLQLMGRGPPTPGGTSSAPSK